jgi:hypothetical protein
MRRTHRTCVESDRDCRLLHHSNDAGDVFLGHVDKSLHGRVLMRKAEETRVREFSARLADSKLGIQVGG